jgi:hypothetical protein
MSEDKANVSDEADVSGSTNDKSDTTGSSADTTGKDQVEEKKYSDKDFDAFVKRKTPEIESRIKSKFDKSLEGKIVLTEKERDDLIKDAVTAALKEESLKSVRAKLQADYGLSEYQISKLEGEDEKSLKEDAEKTYGKIKKQAPVLNGASDNKDGEAVSTVAQQTHQALLDLKKKYHVK